MPSNEPAAPPIELPKKRLYWGIGIYVTGQLMPLCIPLITSSALSESLKASLSALVFFGLSPLFGFSAIAILGRDGFNFLKARLFAFFKLHAHVGSVGKARYYTGLALLAIPLLLAWLTPYLSRLLPMFEQHEIAVAVTGDIILIVSLLVLGGDFWEKLRGLCIHQPKTARDLPES